MTNAEKFVEVFGTKLPKRQYITKSWWEQEFIPPTQNTNQKTGHWIEHEIEGTSRWLECSNCHYETYNVKHNYCMNCGARMESEDKDGK